MALSVSLYLSVCMCASVLKSHTVIFYIYLFVHKKISVCVRCTKVQDASDSLCAVYYRILCNYIITANHPPEVAKLCGNTVLQNKHSDLSTSHTH